MMPPRATTNQANRLAALLVGAGAALNVTILAALLRAPGRLNSDFMAFFAYPRFIAAQPPVLIYNQAALTAFEQRLYPGFDSFYPCMYPPSLLPWLGWLRALPFGPAEAVWSALGVLALGLGVRPLFARPWLVLLALLASPAALLNAAMGQTGFFTAGLLLGGFGLLPRRPGLAGLCFGLLTLKPQLGVLIPVFLLLRGEWRAIGVAGITALGLAGLACLLLPPAMWNSWLAALPAYQNGFLEARSLNMNSFVSPIGNLAALHVPLPVGWAVQLACALVVAGLVGFAARALPYRLAVALLLVGTLLAEPHGYGYDCLPVIAALALAWEASPGPASLAVGALAFLAPLLLLTPAAHGFLYAPVLALLFAMILTLALAARKSARFAHEPDDLLSAPAA